ncbi:hypothetical protein ACFL0Z_02470 [Patescibacteria group bacterium]
MLNNQEKRELAAVLKNDGLSSKQTDHAIALVDEYLGLQERFQQLVDDTYEQK